MNLITRYLIKRLAVASCYALFAILALYSFIDLISETSVVGQNQYTLWVATQYILMQMPARAYQLMPLATLIGGLVALNQLANNSELAVIKTSGLSTGNIIGIIIKFSAIFAIATVLLGEWLAPELSRRGDEMKANARAGHIAAAHNGIWIKQPGSMINVASMLPDNTLVGIKIWHYNDQFQLTEAISAEKATVASGKWQLHNTHSTTLANNRAQPQQQAEREWQTFAQRITRQTRANELHRAHPIHPLSQRKPPANPSLRCGMVEQTYLPHRHRGDGIGCPCLYPQFGAAQQHGLKTVWRHLPWAAVLFHRATIWLHHPALWRARHAFRHPAHRRLWLLGNVSDSQTRAAIGIQ